MNDPDPEKKMSERLLDEERFKQLLKEAVIAALSERRDLFCEAVAEAF